MFGPQHDLDLLHNVDIESELEDPKSRRYLLAYMYFFHRLLFRRVNSSWEIQGCSFSQKGAFVLLVVKGTHEDTPYVAFVTERTTTDCVLTFGRQWLEGRVKWHKDKYREI